MLGSRGFLLAPEPIAGWEDRYQTCIQAALYYTAYEGIPVFPVNGKIPYAGTTGFKMATTDRSQILSWWKRWPTANVGVPTGKVSRWLVVDVDGRHGGFESLRHLEAMACHRAADLHREFETFSATRTAKTGSGLHLVYAYPDDLPHAIKNTVELADLPGIDIRAQDGYVVVAPSLHPSGERYEWLSEIQPAPLPGFLLDHFQREWQRADLAHAAQVRQAEARRTVRRDASTSGYDPQNPHYWLSKALDRARVGSRHKYALFLACHLIEDVGLSMAQAESYMHEYVRGVPGGEDEYDIGDALRCLEWAYENAA